MYRSARPSFLRKAAQAFFAAHRDHRCVGRCGCRIPAFCRDRSCLADSPGSDGARGRNRGIDDRRLYSGRIGNTCRRPRDRLRCSDQRVAHWACNQSSSRGGPWCGQYSRGLSPGCRLAGRACRGRLAGDVRGLVSSGMIRVRVNPTEPETAILEHAAEIIAAGGVIALPTDTLYGLAADPFCRRAVARVFAVKGRSGARALPLIVADREQIVRCIGTLPQTAERLARAFWPGPLTLLLEAPRTLPDEVTAGTGRVGVRVPAHEVARGACRVCGIPLTATSANLSDEPATADPDEVARTLGGQIDLLLDAGIITGGRPSTIVDVTGSAPRLVRSGAVPWDRVLAYVEHE